MEIKFNNVSYRYNNSDKVILENINLNIKSGTINAIIGPSGAGKSTLIELINGLKKPSEGTIKVGNYKIENNVKIKNINDLRKDIGIVFQFPEEQVFNSTVEKEIAFSLHHFNFKTNIIDKHISDALLMVGLNDTYKKLDPYEISSGEIRKVAIASILAYNPKVLIFDEPTVGLDNISKKNLILLIKKLKTRYNKTIIIVSHDIEFLLKLVDTVTVINEGKIVLNGTKKEVFTNVDILKQYNIDVPKVMLFKDIVKNRKNVKLPYREDVNDLIKDIYRYVK